MSKIVIMESLGISAEELAARKAPFEAQGHVFVDYPKTTDPAKLIEEAKDADAMILANMPMPADVLRKCDKLKFIDVAFTGVDHVGLDAAKEKNIAVSNASGYSNEGKRFNISLIRTAVRGIGSATVRPTTSRARAMSPISRTT